VGAGVPAGAAAAGALGGVGGVGAGVPAGVAAAGALGGRAWRPRSRFRGTTTSARRQPFLTC
jgi:hypothetical protein